VVLGVGDDFDQYHGFSGADVLHHSKRRDLVVNQASPTPSSFFRCWQENVPAGTVILSEPARCHFSTSSSLCFSIFSYMPA
jgi:hypothetical protein